MAMGQNSSLKPSYPMNCISNGLSGEEQSKVENTQLVMSHHPAERSQQLFPGKNMDNQLGNFRAQDLGSLGIHPTHPTPSAKVKRPFPRANFLQSKTLSFRLASAAATVFLGVGLGAPNLGR